VRRVSVHVEVVFDQTDPSGGDGGGRCLVLVNKVGAQKELSGEYRLDSHGTRKGTIGLHKTPQSS
jgi:hypothetical protein